MNKYVAGALALFFLAGCSDDAPVVKPVAERPVKVIEIEDLSSARTASFPAVIAAGRTADLSFLVSGVITELLVNEAEEVAEGEAVARLDAQDYQNNVTSARASFANAEDEYQRAVRLADQDAIATSVLEQRKTQRDVAAAQLETAEKALADTVLYAPFTGAVANVPAREQQTVSAGTLIATIIDVETLEATVNVPANLVARVPADGEPNVVVALEAMPDVQIPAVFGEANLVADATSQTYSVSFVFEAPDEINVLPGMNATVLLEAPTAGLAAVTVPMAAVQSDGDGQYVWLIDPESSAATRREIEVADGIGENLRVLEGLSPGDRIVGAGGAYLTEGARVTAWKE